MDFLRKFPSIIKLKSLIFLKKNVLNVKFYSEIINNKFLNSETKNNKNHILNIETQLFMKSQNNNLKKCASINFSHSKSEDLYCQKKDSISVAIVGGGCATIYSVILLKQNPAIKVIHVIDTDNSLPGPIYDIGQIDTSTTVIHYKRNSIVNALHNIDIVALMDETHFSMGNKEPFYQFESSSNYVKNITEYIINTCPTALIAVFTHPVTATLPLISEICKLYGNWNPNKIIGSASLESMRISAMVANLLHLNPSFISTPIAGGVDSLTVVPLLSRTKPFNSFTDEQQYVLIDQLKSVDKYLHGSETKGPTLSSGLAAAKFISTLINGLNDQSISMGSAYVRSDILPFCHYMTCQIQFGPNGVQRNFGFPKVSSREILLIEEAAVTINKIVNTVTHFIHSRKIK